MNSSLNFWLLLLIYSLGSGINLILLGHLIELSLSFSILFGILILFFDNQVLKKRSMFDLIVFSYYFVFLYLAPIIQTHLNIFPNNIVLEYEFAVFNVLLSTIFLVTYWFATNFVYNPFYHSLSWTKKIRRIALYLETNGKSAFRTFFTLSILLLFIFKEYIFNISETFEVNPTYKTAYDLLVSKFLLFVPFVPFYVFSTFKCKPWKRFFGLFSTVLLLALSKNPFNEKRALLGSIYMSILTYFLLKSRSFLLTKGFLVGLLVSIVLMTLFLYPTVKALTHSSIKIFELGAKYEVVLEDIFNYLSDFTGNITSLDYDSWANAMVTLKYTWMKGHSWGKQLVTSLTFFVPRALYPNKGEGTGGIIGDFVISNYGGWQRQISNPLYSEFYYDLSFFGVFLGALFLDFLRRFSNELKVIGNDYLYLVSLFIDFYTLYLLRGDFISCFAYLTGYFVAVLVLPYIYLSAVGSFRTNIRRLAYD
ncbi:hypothetical protein [Fervidobacterium thailandense]|uniref:Oligosaccharide repeat unit polymerase n=1 Tax=Fervidobacterium thailandense TaxID=1008305 RepID=A0A1E3G0I6_9BACT|nr:hypothetical protein [Fervidobacterium thailandense]ODN29650.1 hypothetical protein A4H02_09640 [Fervidobacterium thailandense]